jgi:hypothetical protein
MSMERHYTGNRRSEGAEYLMKRNMDIIFGKRSLIKGEKEIGVHTLIISRFYLSIMNSNFHSLALLNKVLSFMIIAKQETNVQENKTNYFE